MCNIAFSINLNIKGFGNYEVIISKGFWYE